MTFEQAMSWCKQHDAIWGLGSGSLGRGRQLWLRAHDSVIEITVPLWRMADWPGLLTRLVEQMRDTIGRPSMVA